MSFDGTDDYVIGSDARMPSGTTPRTIGAWIKTSVNTGNGRAIFSYGTPSVGTQAFVVLTCDTTYKLCVSQWGSLVADTSTTISDGTWHHVVATYDGSTTYNLYVDGRFVKTGAMTTNTVLGGNFYIGRSLPGDADRSFNGQIDDVRIYNYALTKQQIQQVFNQGSAVRFGPQTGTP